ncbi:MAG TPA: HlyD family efflux transporter periplasmic adaptor subunit [Thermoanaerobaculia bacterium]|nr:HlyD family efflux transporter periplasmic adaptor subunit [Thermoanaerobaculia bacterium]
MPPVRRHPERYLPAVRASLCALLLALAACGDRVELVGVVERTSLELTVPESEELAELPKRVGDAVAAGEVVARLRSEVAELDLEASQALHRAAEANLQAAEREFGRYDQLRRRNVATASDLDGARRTRDEAVALLAERAARRAQAERRLADLTVRTTVDGVVDQLPYEVGERLPAGAVAAVVLADEAPWVRVWLPSRAVARLAPGAAAVVHVEGIDGDLRGKLAEIAREAEYTPHYALTEKERDNLVYEARVVLEAAPADLRPGLPADVHLALGAPAKAADER